METMSIYHDLELMKKVAIAKSKEHNCNYNIILRNPIDGQFDASMGSTYEMVMDSYFEKERPNVIVLFKTDDLVRLESLKEGDHIAFGFNYNGGEPEEIIVSQITSVHDDQYITHFSYGYKSLSETVSKDDILAIGDNTGIDKIRGWGGNYRIIHKDSHLLKNSNS